MTMPARLCAGRESEFRDPHMRLVDLDGCNSLWASGHDGFLSVGGIVGIEIRRILPRARSLGGSVNRRVRVGLLATLAWGAYLLGRQREEYRYEQRICAHGRCLFAVLRCFNGSGCDAVRTLPDGSTKISELKTGETLLRPPVTHSDEALDDVDSILIELKAR